MHFDFLKKIYYTIDSFLYTKRNLFVYKNKIKRLIDGEKLNNSKLTSYQKNDIKSYFLNYGIRRVKTHWHLFYSSLNGKFSIKYIPEDIFYTRIEPALNEDVMYPALEDKNLLEAIFPSILQPKTIIKNINSSFYYAENRIDKRIAIDKCAMHLSFIIKPSIGTDGGKGVALVKIGNDSVTTFKKRIESIFDKYCKDFIVQEVLTQSKDLSILNPTSINTIRVMSYLRQNEVVMLSIVLRIGRLNSFVDNGKYGGIACGVEKDGRLKKVGYDSRGKKYFATDTGQVLYEFQIPVFQEVLKKVKSCHEKIPFFKIVSWDFAIDKDNNVVLIEYNSRSQGINRQQLNNGPLLGEFSEEILKLAMNYNPTASKIKFGK